MWNINWVVSINNLLGMLNEETEQSQFLEIRRPTRQSSSLYYILWLVVVIALKWKEFTNIFNFVKLWVLQLCEFIIHTYKLWLRSFQGESYCHCKNIFNIV
jgi:hypothetical protein